MNVFTKILSTMFSLVFVFSILADDKKAISHITRQVHYIDSHLSAFHIFKIGRMGDVDEKGNSVLGPYHMAGYYHKNNVMKIEDNSYEGSEEIANFFYFWDGKLIFVRSQGQNRAKKTKIMNQYYFHKDRMLEWSENSKKVPRDSIRFKERESNVFKEVLQHREMLKDLRNKKKKGARK
jgi:hypothetical protein